MLIIGCKNTVTCKFFALSGVSAQSGSLSSYNVIIPVCLCVLCFFFQNLPTLDHLFVFQSNYDAIFHKMLKLEDIYLHI